MAEWPASATFADRHPAMMNLMQALKAYLDLPQAELTRVARELEEECLARSSSKDEYLRFINGKRQSLAVEKHENQVLPATTGIAEEPGAECIDIARYRAIYHAHSLNSTVYKAEDSTDGRAIVLKVVQLSTQVAPHDIRREAEFMRKTSSCRTIIPLLGTDLAAGGLFMLRLPYMRYDLASLAAKNVLGQTQQRQHLRDLFSAIAAIHELGIIHRDIKPSNILLASPEGPAYLTDFSISWHAELNRNEPKGSMITDVGTGCYRPPELLFGNLAYSEKVDIWAAGCTVAEVAAGGGKTLFNAGALTQEDFLGSDLTLLNSVFRKLGTPTNASWPEATTFRDWGKMIFKDFPAQPWDEILPEVEAVARDLVSRLVVYESKERLSAIEVLQHDYFQTA